VILDKEKLRITSEVIQQIEQTIGKYPPEHGGILGARDDGIISEFYFDHLGKSSSNGYAPDVESINKLLIEDWMPRNVYMVGIVHSHSGNNQCPSCGDLFYGIHILNALDTVDSFYLPIATKQGNHLQINGFIICKDQRTCHSIPILVVQ